MTGQKQCRKCKEVKPYQDFSKHRGHRDGLQSHCKTCQQINVQKNREYQRRWYRRHQEQARAKRKAYYRVNKKPVEGIAEKPKPKRAAEPKLRPAQPQRPRLRNVTLPQKPEVFSPNPALWAAVEAFLNTKAYKRPKTVKGYRNALRLLVEFLQVYELQQWPVDPDAINAYLADCKKRGCKDGTLHNYYRAIRSWLNWCAARGKVDAGVVAMIEKPPKVTRLPKVIKAEDVVKFLNTLKASDMDNWHNVRDVALFNLALDSGMRISELSNLTVSRIDLHQRTIRLEDTKTGEDRVVCFSDEAGQLLAGWLEVRETLLAETTACFVSDGMGALTDSGIRQRLDFWLTKAGLGHFNFHRLRNSYAVYALRARADLLDVQKQLGHTNIATTQRYVAVDDVGRVARHQAANPLGYLAGM